MLVLMFARRNSARVRTVSFVFAVVMLCACNVRVPSGDATTSEPMPDLPSEEEEETGPPSDLPPELPEICSTIVGAGFDCGEGERCTAMYLEGELVSVCTPLAENPIAAGAPCEEFEPFMGPDPCEENFACRYHSWDGTKSCAPHCGFGDGMYWTCDAPDEVCAWTVLGEGDTCVSLCDPFSPDCPDGRTCAPDEHGPRCVLDQDLGTAGLHEACGADTRCAPGLMCGFDFSVEACDGEACCTPLCDENNPCEDELICGPLWPVGMAAAPSGFETLERRPV